MKFNTAAVITEPGNSVKNKTGSWRTLKPVVEKATCTKCGLCALFCPDAAISLAKQGIVIDYEHCKGCGICAKECPAKTILMKKEEK